METFFHYLDDFLIVTAPGSNQCRKDLHALLTVFNRLRVPITTDKLEGPATVLSFLGIEIDTEAMIMRLPARKLEELQALVDKWQNKIFCTKQELQSLVGELQQANKVVRSGRTFSRQMFELLKGIGKKQHLFASTPNFGRT